MKIKCPGCASLLEIPDSAAGKVVKCKCGKQLRAPAAQGAQGAPGKPAAGKPAAGQGTRPTPQPRRAAPAQSKPLAASTPPSGLFDELTDEDLTPVKAVHQPGAKTAIKAPGASAAKLLDEAISGSDRRGEALTMKLQTPRPIFLYLVAIINTGLALLYLGLLLLLFKVVDMSFELPEDVEIKGGLLVLAGVTFGFLLATAVAMVVSCILRYKICWYILLFGFAGGVASRVLGIIMLVINGDAGFETVSFVIKTIVAVGVLVYLHGDSIRAYYQTEGEPIWKIVTANVLGAVINIGFGIAIGATLAAFI